MFNGGIFFIKDGFVVRFVFRRNISCGVFKVFMIGGIIVVFEVIREDMS